MQEGEQKGRGKRRSHSALISSFSRDSTEEGCWCALADRPNPCRAPLTGWVGQESTRDYARGRRDSRKYPNSTLQWQIPSGCYLRYTRIFSGAYQRHPEHRQNSYQDTGVPYREFPPIRQTPRRSDIARTYGTDNCKCLYVLWPSNVCILFERNQSFTYNINFLNNNLID